MCQLIVKPKDVEIPTWKAQLALSSNPHGWGIAIDEGKRVKVHKGMEKGEFFKALKDAKGKSAIVHCRFATHGKIDEENCHPFAVGDDVWLAHNGIASVGALDEGRSDTYHLARYIVEPLLRGNPQLLGTATLEKFLLGFGPSCKYALIAPGTIQVINAKAGEVDDGVWYSNPWDFFVPVKKSRFELTAPVCDVPAWSYEDETPESVHLLRTLVDQGYSDLIAHVRENPIDVADLLWELAYDLGEEI